MAGWWLGHAFGAGGYVSGTHSGVAGPFAHSSTIKTSSEMKEDAVSYSFDKADLAPWHVQGCGSADSQSEEGASKVRFSTPKVAPSTFFLARKRRLLFCNS
jgi:hypothetical protein